MNPKKVKVFAPATIANIGPGFDILGIAIEQPGDIVIAAIQNERGLTFSLESETTQLPNNHQNVAAHVAQLMLDELKPPFGVALNLYKKMPIGSGLGSSGASCAAAAFAINALLPKPLPKVELIPFAMAGEKLASGSAHADNVAPSLLGGLCIIRSYHPLDIIQLPIKNNLIWIVAHPHLIVQTQDARNLLPKTIPLATVIEQSGNLSGLIAGLALGDNTLLAKSLNDSIAEPLRAPLIPHFYDVKRAALQAGALGFSISGSGPSVFAIANSMADANKIARQITQAFSEFSLIKCDIFMSSVNQEGAVIVEQTP